MPLFSYENIVDPVLRNVREILPVFAGMNAGDSVLDVCCGTGAQVLEFSRHGMLARGIDIDVTMLATALKNQKKLGIANASFHHADATDLPFADNSFDFVSVSFALHDKEPAVRRNVVSEMKRVVKPDGMLIMIDYSVPLPKNIFASIVRITELAAGGSHCRGFQDFIATGGLGTVVRENQLVQEIGDF
jgi:ubiquinone/menaquinone biosynthesis C-methylase UbiE